MPFASVSKRVLVQSLSCGNVFYSQANLLNLHVNNWLIFMKGFALGLALKQRRKATRQLPIQPTFTYKNALRGCSRPTNMTSRPIVPWTNMKWSNGTDIMAQTKPPIDTSKPDTCDKETWEQDFLNCKRVSHSCAERTGAAPKRGLASLAGYTLLWTWKKWMSVKKQVGNGMFAELYCAIVRQVLQILEVLWDSHRLRIQEQSNYRHSPYYPPCLQERVARQRS